MNFDNLAYVRFIQTLYNAINNNTDTSDPNNTVIQYFDAPNDSTTFATQLLSWITSSGQHITQTEDDQLTFTVSATPTLTDPSTIAWGDSETTTNWVWGANGVWG